MTDFHDPNSENAQEQKNLEDEIVKLTLLAESLRQPSVECIPQIDKTSTRVDESRLGGWPAWPKGEDLPKDDDGESMIFLAQINFADAPAMTPYPRKGLLQFFCADDDLYGCELPSEAQSGFRTVFHESVDNLVLRDPYGEELPEFMPFQDEDLCKDGYPLAFKEGTVLPTCEHHKIFSEIEHWWPRENTPADALKDGFLKYLEDGLGGQMYYGGNPKFTQSDFRSAEVYSEYTHVLMQFGMPEGMMWGDAGEACFLLSEADLKNKKFSNAVFNWDCA